MAIEALPFFTYAVWLATAAIPAALAHRSRSLYVTDLALLVVPPIVFLITLIALNEPALTGWAFVLYPVFILGITVLLFHFRVFILPRFGISARAASQSSLAIAVVAAATFGTFVHPLYE